MSMMITCGGHDTDEIDLQPSKCQQYIYSTSTLTYAHIAKANNIGPINAMQLFTRNMHQRMYRMERGTRLS